MATTIIKIEGSDAPLPIGGTAKIQEYIAVKADATTPTLVSYKPGQIQQIDMVTGFNGAVFRSAINKGIVSGSITESNVVEFPAAEQVAGAVYYVTIIGKE